MLGLNTELQPVRLRMIADTHARVGDNGAEASASEISRTGHTGRGEMPRLTRGEERIGEEKLRGAGGEGGRVRRVLRG